nr:zinc finger, CCHC-type, retrotransposon Gag domain protein [Tanacetum cinerariifolium]
MTCEDWMVNTRQSTPEFLCPAFDKAVQQAVNALLPGLTAQITNELHQNGGGGNVDQPPSIHAWKLHLGRLCHTITDACFSYGLTGYMAKDCPKNGRSGSKENRNDKQLVAKGKCSH